jgi:alpha-D-xyloside xylohydrolase
MPNRGMSRLSRDATPRRLAGGFAAIAILVCTECIAFSACSESNGQPGIAGSSDSRPPADSAAGEVLATAMDVTNGEASGEADAAPPPADPVIPLSTGTLELQVWGPRTIRVLYGLSAPVPGPSLAVNEVRPPTPFTVTDTSTELTVATSELQAQVDKTSGQVTFLTPGGSVILANVPSNPHDLSPTEAGPGPATSSETFTAQGTEAFYGLGQHQTGTLAYNGSTTQLLQANPGESSVPLLVSSAGYGVLWDNPSVTTVDLSGDTAIPSPDERNVVFQSEVASDIDYYFLYGPKADDVVASYRALTGAPPLFGRWAWGFWQSKEAYASQDELLGVVTMYRSLQLPIDNIVQDWFYWGSLPWGSHEFDPTNYPDPVGMFDTVHLNNFHAMISVWARFQNGSDNYAALLDAGDFITPALDPNDYATSGTNYYYDPFQAGARALYWQQMESELFAKGVDGWWLDATEPELNTNWGEFRTFETSVGPGAVVYNAYPLMTTTAVHDGQRASTSDKRVFILTRSAYSGQQRNGAVTWSGDINGDWPTFKLQIPAGLNFSISGIPYWTTDIGGFNPQLGGVGMPAYTELYTRWFQFGAFCPMFRSHGGGDRNMWSFGPYTQAILLGVDDLRYRLLPYIYSLSWMVTHDAYSMMRPLVFDFASDPLALNIPDEYMFGPAILVNPVTDAGATSRSVYLPAKTTWYDLWAGTTQTGGQTVMADAPIEHIPLYVPAGAILPMGPVMEYATAIPCDPIELRVYEGADGGFTLYEDENDNYDYEKGMYATIPFAWNDAKKTLTIGARQGSFPGMLQSRTFNVVFVTAGHGVGVGTTATADKTVTYTGTEIDVSAP